MKYSKEQILAMQDKAEELAVSNFTSGMNCAESVFAAILQLGISDFPFETVAIASGLGGGIGGSGNICGAVNGGAMGIGAVCGRKNPLALGNAAACKNELHDKDHGLYKYVGEYVTEIKDIYGKVNCKEFTGSIDTSKEEGKQTKAKTCKGIVALCARTAMKHIADMIE